MRQDLRENNKRNEYGVHAIPEFINLKRIEGEITHVLAEVAQ